MAAAVTVQWWPAVSQSVQSGYWCARVTVLCHTHHTPYTRTRTRDTGNMVTSIIVNNMLIYLSFVFIS